MVARLKSLPPSLRVMLVVFAIISALVSGELGLLNNPVSAGPHPSRANSDLHADRATSDRLKHSVQDDQVIVEHISDGDTLTVIYRGQRERIRLVGIDAPESSDNEKAFRDAKRTKSDVRSIVSQGKRSTAYTQSLVRPGEILRIEFDVERRDRFGRLLAYLYLPSGEMLNRKIVTDGYASPYTRPPNVRYAKTFQRAFEEARLKQRGLWAKGNP